MYTKITLSGPPLSTEADKTNLEGCKALSSKLCRRCWLGMGYCRTEPMFLVPTPEVTVAAKPGFSMKLQACGGGIVVKG